MQNIPSLLFFTAFCAAAAFAQAPTGRAASSQDIEMKVTLESVLEKRLETVLRKVLASEDVFVVANVELLDDSQRPEVEVLPGVMVKQTPASSAPMELPASLVKRITISVFLTHSMSGANLDVARATAERMVGLKPERGDVLNVETVGAPPAKTAPYAPFLEKALNPGTVLLLAWLLAACWGLVHVSRRFLDPCLNILREAVRNPASAGTERAQRNHEEEDRVAALPTVSCANGAGGLDERKLPFSFIRERDLPALELLLSEQSDAQTAIVVHYLPAALGARVLSTMSAPKREMILASMSKPVMIDTLEVKKIEETVLSRIDYIMGGEEKLVAMLDSASTALQAHILQTVRRSDPELGRRLGRRVVLIEDIGLLDEAGLSTLSRQATVRGMAVVLKSVPQLREAVLPKLKTGLGEWLAQETTLIGDLPEQVKENEMRRVLQTLTRLVREGKIILRKDSPASSATVSTNGTQ